MRNISFLSPLVLIIVLTSINFSQSYYGINLDTVKAQRFDMGKMWTFENPPVNYLKETYNMDTKADWFDKLQKSALKFGNGCSASFISEDGLIMTNHHCVRGVLYTVQKDGENILKNGFYATTKEEERTVPNLKVEQLMFIKDITGIISIAMNGEGSAAEKIKMRDARIDEIKNEYAKENPELTYKVVSLYNGGKYSLYGYKVYTDIRLVFVPELFVAKLGGDPDNFTYPRYGLDCAFLRAYENGKPIKTNYYFKWNTEGVVEDQPVFVIGNPGRTDRIRTIAQIEFARDIRYPMLVNYYKEQYKIYDKLVKDSNAEDFSLIATLYSIGNGLKVFEGTYKGLLDLFLIARKKDFENQFRNAVNNNPNLKEKYGNIWDEISQSTEAAKVESAKFFTYQMRNQYVIYAQGLLDAAKQLKDGKISRASYDSMVTMIYPVKDNKAVVDEYVKIHLKGIQQYLSKDDLIYKYWLGNKNIQQAFDELISISQITSREKFIKFSQLSYDEILNSDDPFIYFVVNTQDEINKMKKSDKERSQKEQIANQKLGEALYAVYGDAIPPDATGTLRFADGIVKGYDYNGTKAPIKTTFYGALDRYYSFDKKFPFNLPSYWEKLPEEFDPSTPLNFISTNDIVGGNSGSAVVNSNSEIVGLAFDGNIESLPNTYIYTTEANRTVCVSALGMVEAIRDVYKATRLSNELLKGKSE